MSPFDALMVKDTLRNVGEHKRAVREIKKQASSEQNSGI
jgi:hypothetical protein